VNQCGQDVVHVGIIKSAYVCSMKRGFEAKKMPTENSVIFMYEFKWLWLTLIKKDCEIVELFNQKREIVFTKLEFKILK